MNLLHQLMCTVSYPCTAKALAGHVGIFRVKKRVQMTRQTLLSRHVGDMSAAMLPTCLQSMLRRVPSLSNQHVDANMWACTHVGISTNGVTTLPRHKNQIEEKEVGARHEAHLYKINIECCHCSAVARAQRSAGAVVVPLPPLLLLMVLLFLMMGSWCPPLSGRGCRHAGLLRSCGCCPPHCCSASEVEDGQTTMLPGNEPQLGRDCPFAFVERESCRI